MKLPEITIQQLLESGVHFGHHKKRWNPKMEKYIFGVRNNVHIIADSNHGYKMIGVGKLIADEVLDEKSELLEPFRFSRFELGKLHPISNSPFPWS